VILATRRYCARLPPLDFHPRSFRPSGDERKEKEAKAALEQRLAKNRLMLDDSPEHECLWYLEQLDRVSFKAQDSVIGKLTEVNRMRPLLARPVELERRESMLPWLRSSLRHAAEVRERSDVSTNEILDGARGSPTSRSHTTRYVHSRIAARPHS